MHIYMELVEHLDNDLKLKPVVIDMNLWPFGGLGIDWSKLCANER